MIDSFANFFSNPFNIIMVAIFVCIGVLIGLLFRPRAKNSVRKLIPRDRRFVDFNVMRENAFSVECEEKKGFPPQRFVKMRPGYTGRVGKFLKKAITCFLGIEGTAYTQKVESGTEPLGSLADALRGLWGDDFYMQVPEPKRKELEESKINVTVNIDPEYNPEDFPEITEEQIFDEEDRRGAETYWKGKKEAEKGKWLDYLFILGAGIGIALTLQILGILRI